MGLQAKVPARLNTCFFALQQATQGLKAGETERIVLQKDLEVARTQLTSAVASRDLYKTVRALQIWLMLGFLVSFS